MAAPPPPAGTDASLDTPAAMTSAMSLPSSSFSSASTRSESASMPTAHAHQSAHSKPARCYGPLNIHWTLEAVPGAPQMPRLLRAAWRRHAALDWQCELRHAIQDVGRQPLSFAPSSAMVSSCLGTFTTAS